MLFSCKHKDPRESDFMQKAVNGGDYKIVLFGFKAVQDSLQTFKKRPIDTNAVIYEYNTIAGSKTIQAKTIAQVIKQMDIMIKDSSFLKNVQKNLADTLAKNYRDSISKK